MHPALTAVAVLWGLSVTGFLVVVAGSHRKTKRAQRRMQNEYHRLLHVRGFHSEEEALYCIGRVDCGDYLNAVSAMMDGRYLETWHEERHD